MTVISYSLPQRISHDGLTKLLGLLMDPDPRPPLVLRGHEDTFCLGLDPEEPAESTSALFADVLVELRTGPRITVAVVQGMALGGGVGLAAACDHVLAGPKARFGLPEALFGLTPAMISPILLHRLSEQALRSLALQAGSIDVTAAAKMGLVDDVWDQNTDHGPALRRYLRGTARCHDGAVARFKARSRASLAAAVSHGAEATRTDLQDGRVSTRLADLERGVLPWSR